MYSGRFRCLVVLAIAPQLAASIPVRGQTDSALRSLAEQYWDGRMERNPTTATSLGDYRFNDRIEDVSVDAERRWDAFLARMVDAVEGIPERRLCVEDRLTRDLLKRALRDERLRLECLQRFTSLEPLDGPHLRYPLMLVSQPFHNLEDYLNYVARLRSIPKQVDDHIANMRDGISRGIVSPRVLIEKVVPQIRVHIVGDETRSEFYKPVRSLETLDEEQREQVRRKIAQAIKTDVVPAYRKLLTFVEAAYLPACTPTVGIGAVSGGKDRYQRLAYLHTTVRIAPKDLHELGLSEVARIRDAMAKIQPEIWTGGDLDAFLEHMRTAIRFRFQSREELVTSARTILERAKPLMPKLFGRLPEADCVLKEIEAFRAPSSPVAYYNPPPEDGSRPGYYYINTFAPEERLRFTLEALTYHESIPGHHLQIALDQENKALPKFRRYGSFTAYVEGWALYSEKLGYEIGGYETPWNRFGQLTMEMWRACRLVVDTGMHVMGWSRGRAVEFMTTNTSLAPIDIAAEVDRYIAWPGQALAYKIGEMRILKLRKEAERSLGDRFDLRTFHDALLSGGAMPIDVLESRMRTWIAGQAG